MKTILLIDDSKTQAINLMFKLKKFGFEVVICKDGIDGINMAGKILPDLIVCDILMDELSGHQVCRLLKSQDNTKEIPILVYSGLDHKIDQFWAIKAGADGYCCKDTDFQDLITKIHDLVHRFPQSETTSPKENRQEYIIDSQHLKSKVNYLLDSSLIQSTVTNEFRHLYKFIHDEKLLTEKIFNLMEEILDFNICGIFYNNEFKFNDRMLFLNINNLVDDLETYKSMTFNFFSNMFSKDLEENESFFNYEVIHSQDMKLSKLKKKPKFLSSVFLPMHNEYGDLLGSIAFYSTHQNIYDSLTNIFKLITEELSILLQIKNLYVKAQTLSITDSLTKLYNRRFFQDTVEREFSRAKRYKLDLSIVMFDIDHFKKINDNYGHQYGDEIIAHVAEIIHKNFRKSDCVARYGGEEIVAILPETSRENAFIPCERIRQTIETQEFFWKDQVVHVSMSIGIANITEDTVSCNDLLKNADTALYKAKNTGRNQVVTYNKTDEVITHE